LRLGRVLGGVLLSSFAVFMACGESTSDGTPEAFSRAVPDLRVTEARLSMARRYRGCALPAEGKGESFEALGRLCAEPADLSPSVLGELAPTLRRLAALGDGSATADELHLAGVVELLSASDTPDRIDRAVESLEVASARSPPAAPLLNDLAVARLAQFEVGGQVTALLAGIEAADSARSLDPKLKSARFTLATLMERLGLPEQAASEWEAYVALDPSGPWAEEARARLARIARGESLPDVEGRVSRWIAGDAASITEVLVDEPGRVRDILINSLLPRWAESVLRGTEDERLLGQATDLGEQLALIGNDRSALETARLLAGMSGPDRAAAADAIRMHGRANALYLQARYQDAAPQAAAALATMERLDLPLAAWAANTLAANASYAGDYQAADSLFLGMVREGDRLKSNAMKGRGHWGYSLGQGRRGLLEVAMAHRDSAAMAYQEAGEREPAGFMSLLQSEVLMRQGEVDEGLRSYWMALNRLSRYRRSHRLHNTLMIGAREVSALGFRRAGLRMQLEGVAVAEASGIAQFSVEAEGQLARLYLRAGSDQRAAELARSARSRLPEIADRGMSDRNRADLNLVFAELALGTGASGAELSAVDDSLLAAQEAYESAELLSMRLRVYPLRAAVLEWAGDLSRAMALLSQGVELVEGVAEGRGSAAERATSLDGATELFDALIGLQMRAGLVSEALDTSERARAALGGASGAPGWNSDVEEIGRVLATASGSALLLEYAVLPDQLVAWLVDGGGAVESHVQALSSESLDRRIDDLRLALRRGESTRVEEQARALYRLLIEPFGRRIVAADRLFIVPDKSLHGLPFAALQNPEDGVFLTEKVQLASVPQGSLLGKRRRPDLDVTSLSSLVVGAPDLSESGLAPLPQVAIEVQAVAAVYGDHASVELDATRDRILSRLGEQEVFHFAGHALFDPLQPRRSHLVVSDGASGSAEVTSADIAALDLSGLRLVVLSACSTVSQNRTRTGGLQGLGQAFLAAGSGGIIGSLWPVDDLGAREFSVRFHQALLRVGDPVLALQQTQLSLRAAADQDPRLRGVWAAFQYLGR
jgi:CHAT domain-containing protein